MLNEILEKLKSKLKEAGQYDFALQVETTYKKVEKKSKGNRDKHFKIQSRILYCSAAVSLINVLVTFSSSVGFLGGIAPVLTAASSAVSILVTTMIAVKGSKKYSETWLRHQMHQADMEFEILDYVYNRGKYKTGTDEERAGEFIDAMTAIWKKNQERFSNNMANFDKD